MGWISVHIFHGGDLDSLIAHAVCPLVKRLREQGQIERYFFVRYWNGGPHVRLRLDQIGEAPFSPESYFELFEFFKENTGQQYSREAYEAQVARMDRMEGELETLVDDPRHVAERSEPLQAVPSVQQRIYRFDTLRYGDERARAITEGHFCRASDLAIDIISRSHVRRASRLTVALHLTAAAVRVIRLPPDQCARLFEQAGQCVSLIYPELGETPFLALNFPSFRTEREELSDLLIQLRSDEPLPGQTAIMNQWIQLWKDELTKRWQELHEVQITGKLGVKPAYLLMDYLHMMNNRLGIEIRDECYLYYLVANGVKDGSVTEAIEANP